MFNDRPNDIFNTVPKFAIRQSEAVCTVLIYQFTDLIWLTVNTCNRTILVPMIHRHIRLLCFRHGYFGWTASRQNTKHGSTKLSR